MTKTRPFRTRSSAASTSSSITRARSCRSAALSAGTRRCLALTRSFTGTAAKTSMLGLAHRIEDAPGEGHFLLGALHDDRGEDRACADALYVRRLCLIPLVDHQNLQPRGVGARDACGGDGKA